MTSRRLIRIKVLHMLYSFTKKEGITIADIERDLLKSIEKSSDLYYLMFLFLTEIRHKFFLKIDSAKGKYIATEEERNPNTRFIENPVFLIIGNNKKFNNTVRNNLLSWTDQTEVINHICEQIVKSEAYQAYMSKSEVTFEDHREIILHIFAGIMARDEFFMQTLEDRNIFWNDDFELVFGIVYKTLKQLKSDSNEEQNIFIPVYKSEEDTGFARELLRKSILEYQDNVTLIDRFIQNWEVERLSEIDKDIMVIAISELKNFPSIPVKVTLDEYIEVAKSYSSAKSSGFINGILDKTIPALSEQGMIKKMGRGLMEGAGS